MGEQNDLNAPSVLIERNGTVKPPFLTTNQRNKTLYFHIFNQGTMISEMVQNLETLYIHIHL